MYLYLSKGTYFFNYSKHRVLPLTRKNARFAHDMVNFGNDVRGKRFSAHAIRVNRDFTLSHVEPAIPSPRMKSVLDEHEKSTTENRSAFLGVGAEGVEPPTLCL